MNYVHVCVLSVRQALGRIFSFLIVMFFLLEPHTPLSKCSADYVDIYTKQGVFRFHVEIADDASARAQGLMFRENLDAWSGMLFVYESPSAVSFWMKNTPIALDILFFSDRGVLQKIAPNTTPFSLESIKGGNDVAFVLEINAGLAQRLGIAEGAFMRHPRVNQALAAQPCVN